jgi:hypothetical protein
VGGAMESDYLKAGKQAVRLIYFLVIGFAITRSLTTLFINNSTNLFFLPPLSTFILFLVFASFISRFFVGAYRVLSYDVEMEIRKPKVLIDLFGFTFQAIAFYVLALSFLDARVTEILLITICTIDTIWLLILYIGYEIIQSTFRQWIAHNLIMAGIILIDIFLFKDNYWVLFGASALAFIVDLIMNGDFYFGFDPKSGYRIFVSGPYGDDNPPDVIARNVEKAKQVGKELTLRGHIPFIPHTMLHGWEDDKRFSGPDFKRIDFAWLFQCQALYFIDSSPGADVEKEVAIHKGMHVYYKMEDVPDLTKKKRDIT